MGCLETMVKYDDSSTRYTTLIFLSFFSNHIFVLGYCRVHRKVSPTHWDWMMPWLSPECARGEIPCTLSDVYSFCCLVWETCSEKLPWSHLESVEIRRMWQRDGYNQQILLQMGSAIPHHVESFLKLGLQPELSERLAINLHMIYSKLTAAISRIVWNHISMYWLNPCGLNLSINLNWWKLSEIVWHFVNNNLINKFKYNWN